MNSSAQFLLAIFLSGVSISTRAQVPSTAPAKKVWTNDDLRTLRDSSGVSTVVPAKNSTVKNGDAPRKPVSAKNAKWYREQIKPLNGQIPPIDAEIEEMHRFQDGSYQSPGGIPLRSYGRAPLNPADRISQLEKQKTAILARVDVLQDEARHAGILPGDLR